MSKNRTTYIITTPDTQTLLLEFRWTVSRGRDTYGYNICTLYVDNIKVSSCNGGGYDMQGTCLGEWLQTVEPEKIKHLNASTYYGLFHYNSKTKNSQKIGSKNSETYLDGACGLDCITRIGNALGYKFQNKG